jgi:CRP/FNR family cyclic AMP-dependent transcriptional regulator
MTPPRSSEFDPSIFLANAGLGRKIVHFKPSANFFAQGNAADFVFYLQSGRAKLTVVSKAGKEATISLLAAGDFIGEESIAGPLGLRMATATAITACSALEKVTLDDLLHHTSGIPTIYSIRVTSSGEWCAHPHGRCCVFQR